MKDIENHVDQLMSRGHDLLDSYDYEAALEAGKQLIELRHTSGFEIAALAYKGLESENEAIATLERGVEIAPTVWLLWNLLGNCFSDAARFEDALRCYEAALGCPGVDRSMAFLNLGIVKLRQEEHQEALDLLSRVASPELLCRKCTHSAEAFLELGDIANAEHEAEAVLDLNPDEIDSEDLAHGLAMLAQVRRKQGRDDEALDLAWKAIDFHSTDPLALWLVRHIRSHVSPQAKYFRLLLEGFWHQPFEGSERSHGFFMSYDVVADTPEEALEYAREFQIKEVRPSLQIEECELIEECPNEPKGVYWHTGRHFFLEEDDNPDGT